MVFLELLDYLAISLATYQILRAPILIAVVKEHVWWPRGGISLPVLERSFASIAKSLHVGESDSEQGWWWKSRGVGVCVGTSILSCA